MPLPLALLDDIDTQRRKVAERVAGQPHAHELALFEAAVEQVGPLVTALGLGEYIGSYSVDRGKPQLVLRFSGSKEMNETGPVVLKVYGFSFVGEPQVQYEWTKQGGAVVPTLTYSNTPVSSLLMRDVPGHDLSQEKIKQNPRLLGFRSKQLGAVMAELHTRSKRPKCAWRPKSRQWQHRERP